MLFGGVADGGALELRRDGDGSIRLRGRFPYNVPAVLSDGGRTGRPRKESIASRAFRYRVEREEEDIHLLAGHSYDRPLASRGAGSLDLRDSDEALTFDARITREIAETSHGRDTLALIGAGLSVGLSPGFRIPPERVAPNAETVTEEPDDGTLDDQGQPRRGAIIRQVNDALLFELSIVTRPAFKEAQVEMRSWQPGRGEEPVAGLRRSLARWRP